MTRLTPDEQQILEQAKHRGYLIASGQRLQVLWAWRAWCRENGRPCVVGQRGARQATIEVDGKAVANVDPADLERKAAQVVAGEQTRKIEHVPSLFEGVQ